MANDSSVKWANNINSLDNEILINDYAPQQELTQEQQSLDYIASLTQEATKYKTKDTDNTATQTAQQMRRQAIYKGVEIYSTSSKSAHYEPLQRNEHYSMDVHGNRIDPAAAPIAEVKKYLDRVNKAELEKEFTRALKSIDLDIAKVSKDAGNALSISVKQRYYFYALKISAYDDLLTRMKNINSNDARVTEFSKKIDQLTISTDITPEVAKEMKEENKDDKLSDYAIYGVEEVDSMLLRKYLATGGGSNNDGLISGLMQRSYSQRLFIYYLLENDNLDSVTALDVMKCMTMHYKPDGTKILRSLMPRKTKFMQAVFGANTFDKIKTEKLSQAICIANRFSAQTEDFAMYTKTSDESEWSDKEDDLKKQIEAGNTDALVVMVNRSMKLLFKYISESEKLKNASDEKKKVISEGLMAMEYVILTQYSELVNALNTLSTLNEKGQKIAKLNDPIKGVISAAAGMDTAILKPKWELDFLKDLPDNVTDNAKTAKLILNYGVGATAGLAGLLAGINFIASSVNYIKGFSNMTWFDRTQGFFNLTSVGGAAVSSTYTSVKSFALLTSNTAINVGAGMAIGVGVLATGLGIAEGSEYLLYSRKKKNAAKEKFQSAQAQRYDAAIDEEIIKRDATYEENLVKLSERIGRRRVISGGFKVATGTLATVGGILSTTGILAPGFAALAGFSALLVGLVGVASDKSLASKDRKSAIYEYLGVDQVFNELMAAHEVDVASLGSSKIVEIKEEIKNQLMGEAGFVSEKAYFADIMHKYAAHIHEKLFAIKSLPKDEQDALLKNTEYQAYKDLARSLRIKVDVANNKPSVEIIFKKLMH